MSGLFDIIAEKIAAFEQKHHRRPTTIRLGWKNREDTLSLFNDQNIAYITDSGNTLEQVFGLKIKYVDRERYLRVE